MVTGAQTFKVGDSVAIVSPHNAAPRRRRVTRVMARFVELADGTRWNARGHAYPRSDSWTQPHIEPWTEAHSEALRRQVAIHVIRAAKLDAMGTDALVAMAKLIEAV